MRFSRFAMPAFLAFLILPLASPAATMQLGWSWWSAAGATQRADIVRGELAGILAGYDQAAFIIDISAGLTGNGPLEHVSKEIQKVAPRFSKSTEQYVSLVSATYASSRAHGLSVGVILICYQDPGPDIVSPSTCLSQRESNP